MKTARSIGCSALAAGLILGAITARSAIIVDESPTGPLFISRLVNDSSSQNFLVQFTLGTAANITGFDLFADQSFAGVGDPVRVKIREDTAGDPSAVNLFSFTDTIDALILFSSPVVIASISFGAIPLAAGTYWMGVSGEGTDISWSSFESSGSIGPADQRQLFGDASPATPNIHDLAYRIHGEQIAAAPEPGTLTALGIGLIALLAATRRRN